MNAVLFAALWVILWIVSSLLARQLFRRVSGPIIWAATFVGSGAAVYAFIFITLSSHHMR